MYKKDSASGTPYFEANWEWIDSSKSKIRVWDAFESLIYQVTELNANAAVYGASFTYESCNFLTWEKLGQPMFD